MRAQCESAIKSAIRNNIWGVFITAEIVLYPICSISIFSLLLYSYGIKGANSD